MSASIPSPHRERISVSLKPKSADRAKPLVLAIFTFREDAHLVPDLIANLDPAVDGFVSYDRRTNADPFADEAEIRRCLLQTAVDNGAQWIFAVSPSERIETAIAARMPEFLQAAEPTVYEFRHRMMFSPESYRMDALFGGLKARRLFSISPDFRYDRADFLDQWYPTDPYKFHQEDLHIYDFRTATAARRRLRHDTFLHLDPFVAHRTLAYENLVNEKDMVLHQISPDQPYVPPFREDGGLWSATVPAQEDRLADARERAQESVRLLFHDARSPLFAKPLPGHQRGIDRIDRQRFIGILQETLDRFIFFHGYTPDLFRPRHFLEKMVWRKFFGNLRVPQSGNKLFVASYIPPNFRETIRVPNIVWRSGGPRLPDNDAIPAGLYYLKTNHGSGNVRQIRYPLELDHRIALEKETALWLQTAYLPRNYEWWYNAFPREIFLEESIETGPATITWSYPAFAGGGLPYINVNRKIDGRVQAIRLTRDFEPLPERHQPRGYERLTGWNTNFDAKTVEKAALAIAEPLGFARVDFMFGADGSCYLNEVTLTPNNAEAYLHPELDVALGELWRKLI